MATCFVLDLIKDKINSKILSHKLLEQELLKVSYGKKTRKHLIQASSTLGLLEEAQLLSPNSCYIEFGAGKGQLSYWISKATEELEKCSVLLFERASQRHKKDNKLDKSDSKVERIRADIADLVLEKVDFIKEFQNIVGVTKHLCGEATDLALRCLMNYQKSRDNVKGIVMAFCCHHRCHWTNYVGTNFFKVIFCFIFIKFLIYNEYNFFMCYYCDIIFRVLT